MKPDWRLAGAVGLGATVMYLLDPARGRGRRIAAGIGSRVRGALASTRRLLPYGAEARGQALAARVRRKIRRVLSHADAVEVAVQHGRVVLTGPVLAREVDPLLSTVWRIRGVDQVDVRLELHERPEELPAAEPRPTSAGDGWSPAFRVVAVLSGGSLAAYGLRRRDPLGSLLGMAGAGLTARAVAGRGLARLGRSWRRA